MSFNTALENNTIFLQQFFRFRGEAPPFPLQAPLPSYGKIVSKTVEYNSLLTLVCIQKVSENFSFHPLCRTAQLKHQYREVLQNTRRYAIHSHVGYVTTLYIIASRKHSHLVQSSSHLTVFR